MKAMRRLACVCALVALEFFSAPAHAFDLTSLSADQLNQIAQTLGVSTTTLIAAAADGITATDIAILPAETQTQILSYVAAGGTLPADATSLENLATLLSVANALGIDSGTLLLALADGFDSADLALISPAIQSQLLAYIAGGGTLPADLNGLAALLASLPKPTEMYYSNADSKWVFGAYAASDLDFDGYLDVIEAAAGTSPQDFNARPFGATVLAQAETLNIKSLQIKLNFAKTDGGDGLLVNGYVAVSGAGNRQHAVIYVGGIARAFTLDAKGNSYKTAAPDQLKVSAPKNGVSKFLAKLSSADFAGSLADEKLSNTTVKTQSKVTVKLMLDQTLYSADVNVDYAAKQGKAGKAKKSK